MGASDTTAVLCAGLLSSEDSLSLSLDNGFATAVGVGAALLPGCERLVTMGSCISSSGGGVMLFPSPPSPPPNIASVRDFTPPAANMGEREDRGDVGVGGGRGELEGDLGDRGGGGFSMGLLMDLLLCLLR